MIKFLLYLYLMIFGIVSQLYAKQSYARQKHEQNCKNNIENCLFILQSKDIFANKTNIQRAIDIVMQLVKMHSSGEITGQNLTDFYKQYLNAIIFFAKNKNIAVIDKISNGIFYNQQMLYYTGMAYLVAFEYQKAVELLTQCLFLHNSNSLCLFNIAVGYDAMDDFKNAIFYYNSFVQSCLEERVIFLQVCKNKQSVEARLRKIKQQRFYE